MHDKATVEETLNAARGDSRGEIPRRSSRAVYTKFMIVVRRVHMYAGLLLLPWVLLYGFSGMLFNHPEWSGPVEVVDEMSPSQVNATIGVAPPDAATVAQEVVAALNAQPGDDYDLVADSAVMNDRLQFGGLTDRGRAVVTISPNDGTADVRRFDDGPKQDQPAFHGAKVSISAYEPAKWAEKSATLMTQAGLTPTGPVRAIDGNGNVRFLAESKTDGRRWNVIYNLPTGSLTARAADADASVDLHSFVTRLHTVHHYPDRPSAAWFWVLAADVTGITMMCWAVSGFIMWWQIKRTRVLGVMAVSVGLVAGAMLFVNTNDEMRFGPARRPGPAIGGPPTPSPTATGTPTRST